MRSHGGHGRANLERQALERACQRELANPDVILAALRHLHWLGLAKLTDDLAATAALRRIGDRRASLASAQLAARLTQVLRLDLEGLDELLSELDQLPESYRRLQRVAAEADRRRD